MTSKQTGSGDGHHTGDELDERMDDIQREIDYHRQQVDLTLDSLERRLTPGQMVDQAIHYLRSSGGGEYVRNLGTAVKHNPVPFTLLGVGLGWLMASGTSRAGYLEDEEFGTRSRREGFRDAVGSATESAAETGHAVKDSVAGAGRAVRDKAGDVRARVRSGSDRLRQGARRQATAAGRAYDYVVHEQPLAVTALGFATGMLLGLGVSETRTEHEWMGETRDEFLDRAQKESRELMEQAKDVVRAAVEGGEEEAERLRAQRDREAHRGVGY